MKVVFDEIDHFHPNFDESVPNLRGSTLRGPTLRGPTLRGPTLRGATLRGPTLRGPTFSRLAPHPCVGGVVCVLLRVLR